MGIILAAQFKQHCLKKPSFCNKLCYIYIFERTLRHAQKKILHLMLTIAILASPLQFPAA